MKRIPAVVLAVAAILGSASMAMAQDPDREKKIEQEALEERLKALEMKTQHVPLESKDPLVTFTANNGLKFKSGDGNFEGAIGGRFYFIYRHIFERVDGGTTRADAFDVDTARIQLDGTFYKDFFYRVEAEAGKAADFFLKDGYLGWKGVENWSFQFGQFKEPFSQEENCSSRFNDFAERSILNRIVPAHDIGFMAKTSFADKVVDLEVGFFNGSGRNAAENNDEKDIAARIRVTPFRGGNNAWLKQLRLGLALTYGDVDNLALSDINPGDQTNVNMIDFGAAAAVLEDGVRTRLGFELSWIMGPASVRLEWMRRNQEILEVVANNTTDFDTEAMYIQFTYLLTGENKPLENRVVPTTPFNLKEGGWGAWELAFRYATLDASDADGTTAIAATANQEVTQMTLGVNWWMTQNFRLMLNFEMFKFDEDVPQAGGDPIDDQNVFYTRLQIDF